jgi:DNA-binding CsgD family transcriptional regulator
MSYAILGGLVGMVGGAIIIIGWLLPWSSVGLGSGPQILASLIAGSALGTVLGQRVGLVIVIFVLVLFGLIILIPIMGLLCVATGIQLFSYRSRGGKYPRAVIRGDLKQLQKRATYVFVLMALFYIFASFIPFIGAIILGRGFYYMVSGAVLIFLGALFAKSQVEQIDIETDYSSGEKQSRRATSRTLWVPPKLTEEDREVLKLLAQNLSNSEIAEELDIERTRINMLIITLLEKFKVQDRVELVKRAREQRVLPPEN